jgi:hypothetical protein
MTKSSKSVFFFGIYLLLTGIFLCALPQKFISILSLPEIPTAWARLIGVLVIILGSYYVIAGRNNLKPLITGTIYLRLFFFAAVMILFVSGQMPKEILPLGVIDLLGAVWTMLSVKADAKDAAG